MNMFTDTYRDVNEALPQLAAIIMGRGERTGSRGGQTMEILMPHFTLTEPLNREVTVPGRKASLPAQIAETAWVLAGRDDIEWLSHYLPRAAEFSDDGKTWRAAYGPRLRRWETEDEFTWDKNYTDQLANVVSLLRTDRATRRAVISLWDPALDYPFEPSKDIPCNNWLHFINRDGKLHLHVAIRSNDLIWGWSGINQFEWSVLLEVVAKLVGVPVGTITYSTTSLHIYERHFAKAEKLANPDVVNHTGCCVKPSPRLGLGNLDRVADLDRYLKLFFELEQKIREGHDRQAWAAMPEPMFRSWLQVLAFHWTHDIAHLKGLELTPLEHAALDSPGRKTTLKAAKGWMENDPCPRCGTKMSTSGGRTKLRCISASCRYEATTDEPAQPVQVLPPDPFADYAAKLHVEKSAVYGDSWKRRGEQMSIIPNIARKVDRLGVAGGGDSGHDTYLDALIYLLKYRLWLADNNPDTPWPTTDATAMVLIYENAAVEHQLRFLGRRTDWAHPTTHEIQVQFEALVVQVDHAAENRWRTVDRLIEMVYPWAVMTWEDGENTDEYRGADHD